MFRPKMIVFDLVMFFLFFLFFYLRKKVRKRTDGNYIRPHYSDVQEQTPSEAFKCAFSTVHGDALHCGLGFDTTKYSSQKGNKTGGWRCGHKAQIVLLQNTQHVKRKKTWPFDKNANAVAKSLAKIVGKLQVTKLQFNCIITKDQLKEFYIMFKQIQIVKLAQMVLLESFHHTKEKDIAAHKISECSNHERRNTTTIDDACYKIPIKRNIPSNELQSHQVENSQRRSLYFDEPDLKNIPNVDTRRTEHQLNNLLREDTNNCLEIDIEVNCNPCKQDNKKHLQRLTSNESVGFSVFNADELPLKGRINDNLHAELQRFHINKEERNRLQTFEKFPRSCPIKAEDLARHGFIYTGLVDRVMCYVCLRCVENWQAIDIPENPQYHKNDCAFVKRTAENIPLPTIIQQRDRSGNIIRQVQYPSNLPQTIRQSGGTFAIGPGNSVIIQSGPGSRTDIIRGPATFGTGQSTRPGSNVSSPFPVFPALPPREAPDQTPASFRLGVVRSAQHKRLLSSLDLNRELDRLASFSGYPSPTSTIAGKTPTELARDGFFYLGDSDRTQCFSCGGIMRNWTREDNVHQEHATHFRRCRMVAGQDERNVYVPDSAFIPNAPPASENERKQLFPCDYPNSPHMRSLDARLNTFDGRWPHSSNALNTTIREICEAGFFYLGENDRTKCWYCSGGLQHWEPTDEPWTEHAKWFPTCQYLLQQKGVEYVYRILSRYSNLQRPNIIRQQPSETSYMTPAQGRDVPPSQEPEERTAPAPIIIDPQAELKKKMEKINDLMKESPTVKAVKDMGVDEQVILFVLKSRIGEEKPDFENVEELLTATFEQEEKEPVTMDEDEDIPRSAAAMAQERRDEDEDMDFDLYGEAKSTAVKGTIKVASTLPKDPESARAALSVLEEERKCKVCLDRDADVVFIPCSHLCCCLECTQALRKCPLCRVKIEKAIKVYTK